VWYRLAFHLGTTVEALQREITFSEFLEWYMVLEREEQWKVKIEHYLAQLAAEVRRGWVSDPKKVHVEDFFIRFKEDGETEDRVRRSKKTWATFLKMNLN
jgi:hypothetical protein